MAEIIKSGSKPAGWNKVVKCTGKSQTNGSGCGTKFRVFAEDVYRKQYGTGGGESEYSDTVCCPECGQESEITRGPDVCTGTQPSHAEMRARREKWNTKFKRSS